MYSQHLIAWSTAEPWRQNILKKLNSTVHNITYSLVVFSLITLTAGRPHVYVLDSR